MVSGPSTVAFNAPRGPEWVARWDVIRRLQQSNLRPDQIRQLQRLLQRRLVEEDVGPIDAAIIKITANPSLLDLIERATDGDISAFAFAEGVILERRPLDFDGWRSPEFRGT